jgi:L-fucose mutarotase
MTMLRYRLLHPEILAALGTAGHGSRILIADGNFPFDSHTYARARRVYLNFAPDMLKVTDVLNVLVDAIPIEAAHVMMPDTGVEPAIFSEFRAALTGLAIEPLERFAFYDAARQPDVALVIATGERRVFANLLLTIGVVAPE